MINRRAALLLIPLLLAIVVGCSDTGLPLVPVEGTVTFDGGPPPTVGTVTFMPVSVQEGLPHRPATARFDKDGFFQVSSFKKNDGLLPGTYHATVDCWLGLPSGDDPSSFERLNAVPKDFRLEEVVVDAGTRSVHVEIDVPKK